MSSEWEDMEEKAASEIGRALAKKRWDCAGPAERKAQGEALLEGRRKKARKRARRAAKRALVLFFLSWLPLSQPVVHVPLPDDEGYDDGAQFQVRDWDHEA